MNRDDLYPRAELDIFIKYYPDAAKIHALLPHRTISAIRNKAASLGLQKKIRRWTPDRIDLLRQVSGKVSDREAALMLGGGSTQSILHRRRRSGFVGISSTPASAIRVALAQDIMDHVRVKGFSLRDITSKIGTTHRFRPSGDEHRLSYAVAAKVVEALEGELYAEWDD